MKLAIPDRRLLQTGKIDKLIAFLLSIRHARKAILSALKSVGGGGGGGGDSATYGTNN